MGKTGGKAAFRLTEKQLVMLGYRLARVNSKNWNVYTHDRFPDVALNPSVSEREARHLVKKLERQHGIEQETHKRNACAIKERRRLERLRINAAMDRLDAERAALIRRKELLPDGDFDGLARKDRLALEREIQRVETERREWVRLMTQLNEGAENVYT